MATFTRPSTEAFYNKNHGPKTGRFTSPSHRRTGSSSSEVLDRSAQSPAPMGGRGGYKTVRPAGERGATTFKRPGRDNSDMGDGKVINVDVAEGAHVQARPSSYGRGVTELRDTPPGTLYSFPYGSGSGHASGGAANALDMRPVERSHGAAAARSKGTGLRILVHRETGDAVEATGTKAEVAGLAEALVPNSRGSWVHLP